MELLELWRRHLERTKSERTTITYINAIKSFLRKLNIHENVLDISSKEFYQYADVSELSSASLLTHFCALRHFYRFLTRRGFIPKEKFSEIAEAIEDIKEEYGLHSLYRRPKALERSELERIFQKVKGSKYERVYQLFLYSGIRLSEYRSLKPEYFFLDKSNIYWIRLPAEITKRRKERMAPLLGPSKEETYRFNQSLAKCLENYEGTLSVNAGSLQVYTNRLSKKLGFQFSLHSFRHTYITNLINQGFPAELVKEFAGHANVKTTIDIYYRFNPERARSAVENFLKG